MATPILTAAGLGGVGIFGFMSGYSRLFLTVAFVFLAFSFHLNVVKRRSRLNLAVFSISAAFVAGSAVCSLLR